MIGKRGELTAKQLITIIILVVSFSIILIFFFMLNLKQESEIEACHSSVVWRNMLKGLGKLAVNFQCKTQEVVIEETEPNDIYAELAELQRDCFWMMGEGKIVLGDSVCAICSIVEFENEIKGISKTDYINYLKEKNVSGKEETYADYFYGNIDLSKLPDFTFNNNEKYMVFYIYDEKTRLEKIIPGGQAQSLYYLDTIPYKAANVNQMNCDSFATTL